ncbi:unnamed protein product [Didymodactylos carnosus]|uniref:Synaptosomal-associated protein n=1 Tax=Didymodactylos carnosus TaxID=1234261 RepID=A0A814XA33_9BILA|nr:unnamed protein product [Didymodactylos carnosus]CAF3975327.1 unnamed protein product [Didymodactylos carnosus]
MKHADYVVCEFDQCVCPWNRKFRFKSSTPYPPVKHSNNQQKVTTMEPVARTTVPTVSGGYITKITKDAREDEMDDNLQQVHMHLGALKNMAVDMGTTLDRQNVKIEEITDQAEDKIERLKIGNKRLNKIENNA